MLLEQTLDQILNHDWLDDDPTEPLREFPPKKLLASLRRRFAGNEDITVQGNIFDVCAYVIGSEAGPWIREVAQGPISNLIVLPFFRALARCIGDDAFQIATAKLENEYKHQLAMTAHALLAFDSKSRILDWIEMQTCSSSVPITRDWGQLAAIAGITWQRIATWLERGNQLGLVALDALNCCWDYDAGEGGWLYIYEPTLLGPVEHETMRTRLEAYSEQYPYPRVEHTVKRILQHLP